MDDLVSLFEKNLLEHFVEQEALLEKRKEEDFDEVTTPLFLICDLFEFYFDSESYFSGLGRRR